MQDADKMICIGRGTDVFDLKISIEKFHNQLHITRNNNPCWLSYRFFGEVLQSEILCVSADEFTPMIKSFRIRSSVSELMEHFRKNSSLHVHVCANGLVLGTAAVDLLPLMCDESHSDVVLGGRFLDGEYAVYPAANQTDEGALNSTTAARLSITIYLDKDVLHSDSQDEPVSDQQSSSAKVRLSISSQTDLPDVPSEATIVCTSQSQTRANEVSTRQKRLEEKENELKALESQLNKKERQVHESTVALEKKRLEWEQWRHQEECAWHAKLRSKEAAAMRAIEDRTSNIEKERLRSLESSRSEYEKLESRLRNALVEVEAKERQLKEVEVNHLNEQKRKMAELDLREKLMKEELKHTVEIEVRRCLILVCHIWFHPCDFLTLCNLALRYLESKDKCSHGTSCCS